MKTPIHLMIFLLFSICSFGQNEPCIKAKWIAVKNDSTNSHLFDVNHHRIDSIFIFQEIKRLVESKKIDIFNNDAGFGSSNKRQFINHELMIQCWNEKLDSVFHYDPFFEFSIDSDYPLVNEYGEPLINENYEILYPPPKIVKIELGDLYQLHVKEEKIQDKFIPTEVAFCIYRENHIKEVFWIDLEKTLKATENKALKDWIKDILDKKYNGFQFQQAQCDD